MTNNYNKEKKMKNAEQKAKQRYTKQGETKIQKNQFVTDNKK